MDTVLAILFVVTAKHGEMRPPEVEPDCVEAVFRVTQLLDLSREILEAFAALGRPVPDGTELGSSGSVLEDAGRIHANLLVGATTLALLQNTLRASFEVLLEVALPSPPDGRGAGGVAGLPDSIPFTVTVDFQARAVPPTTGAWGYGLFVDLSPVQGSFAGPDQFVSVRRSSSGLVSPIGDLLDEGNTIFEDGVFVVDGQGSFTDDVLLSEAEEVRPGVFRVWLFGDASVFVENGGAEFPAQVDAFGPGGFTIDVESALPGVTIAIAERPSEALFRRGDANADERVDISDGIGILGYLFLADEAPSCIDAADVDDSGQVELTDSVYLFNYLFLGGQEPPAPGPSNCGEDATEDELACVEFATC